MEAWNCLRDIFQDNKHSRAVTLEYDFTHVDMADFPNVSAYCQHLKSLADQLKNVGSPVANDRLVLQLVSGLTETYQGVATLICQCDPLPQFYQARSMLTLEEAGRAKKAAQSSSAALVARSSEGPIDVPDNSSSHSYNSGGKRHHNRNNNGGRSHGSHGSRGGGRGDGSCGSPAGRGGQLGGNSSRGSTRQHSTAQHSPQFSPWSGGQ
ncbi:uncharacterized protein LOC129894535 [Solanum dulcamara]|uniref:uncharacterized protein LOC129894535 n=1 Tax=Solanum dulcamara TaxID=45834 RepID=UPI0024858814|nr:uncharacterized protein LOC129894535 [Solanum dulcamara]